MAPYSDTFCHSTCHKPSYYSWDATDYGPYPLILNIKHDTLRNPSFRTTRWTGNHMQLTLMSIPVNCEIGVENHPNEDQYFCIIEGEGIISMGDSPYNLSYSQPIETDCAVLIPANIWHNLVNTGKQPLKVYCIYSPVVHHADTIHWTKRDSDLEK